MRDRWAGVVKNLPDTDRVDIVSENYVLNNGVSKTYKRQQQPEYSQGMFLRTRSNAEAFASQNCLDSPGDSNADVESSRWSGDSKKRFISEYDRSYAVQKIFDLHARKDYKVETLFTACSIMDRYLHKIGHRNFQREKIC